MEVSRHCLFLSQNNTNYSQRYCVLLKKVLQRDIQLHQCLETFETCSIYQTAMERIGHDGLSLLIADKNGEKKL